MSDNPAVNAPAVPPVPAAVVNDPDIADPPVAAAPEVSVDPATSPPAIAEAPVAAEPGTSPVATRYAARVEQAKTETQHPGHHGLLDEMFAELLRLEHAAARRL
jgi:hypothetical protein